MAINLKFDLMGNPEPPSIILANRNGNKLGQLNVDAKSIDVKDLLKTSEFSFTLNKYIDGELTPLWDKVVDFKLVYCPEWDLWYGIKVELDEATETVKTVFCTQLGQEELSQIKVYNIEINTEDDIARDDYKISILYDEDNPDASILHRVMSKAPHYSIAYIDESLKRIQKSFSFDDASICDVFDEIEEEVGCLVIYNSNSDKNGMPKRDISIYDLLQNCKNPDCKHRGEFTDRCPKCGGTDIDYGYGEDTTIFVTSDELGSQGIQLVTDIDSVKNCFKLEAGDDLMTATVRNCNPNGSDYIWYFSDAVKEDMSKELVEAIENYDTEYKKYYDSYISELDENLVFSTCLDCGCKGDFFEKCSDCESEQIKVGYKGLVKKYEPYYKTKSTCINCGRENYFKDECPSCHSTNILTGKSLQTIDTPITGYPALMNAYYNTIDLVLYLESGLMPSVEMSDTNAEEQLNLLTTSPLSPVAVNVENIDNVSLATANSAVLSMAKVVVRPTYKVQIKNSELSDNKQLWKGQFVITNYSDENDTASNEDDEYIEVVINNETEEFIKQKIEKALNKENTDDLSISGLFDEEKYDYDAFCAELKKYALNPLKSFYDACDACLSILTEQGVGNEESDLYDELYAPYYEKSQAIANEIKIREDEIAIIKGVYNNEENNEPDIDGLQTNIIDRRNAIQDALNFEKYLGEDLWLELCSYRREDKYSNSNYVSDGLNNAELFEKALEFVEVAENEIFKSAELQHSISTSLNNLLAHPKFKPLLKSFKTGNWIRVQVDDRIFKLRLLEYNFNYGDLESIPVEFSDVTKIKNGTTDVQDVFAQAASMASSYDSVQRQAKKGNVARSTIDQWLVDGLSAANVQIQSNDSEEVLLTKNGLLARSYSDITGEYSPEQLKITHNIMAYTDDNWKTVRQSIGKHEYKYFDQDQEKLVDKMGYGMNADFANAAVLCGSQMIGGDIYSNNYSQSIVDGETVTAGSHIDLETGHFSLAGGKLKYDGGELTILGEIEVTTAGRIGCWDINETSIYTDTSKITQEDLLKDKTYSNFYEDDKMYFGVQGLSLGDKFKVEPNGIATMTNANVSGTITASDIIGNNIEGGTITGAEITGGIITAGNTLYIGSQKDEDGNIIANSYSAWIDIDGVLHTNEAHINGTITAIDGMIGGFNIEPTVIEEGVVKAGGRLWSGELQEGQDSVQIGDDKSIFLSATDMSGTMPFYTLVKRKDTNGNTVYDENDEAIYDVVESNLSKEDWRITVGGNFGVTSDGTAYMSNAEIVGGSLRMGTTSDDYHTWISSNGVLNANGVNISGTINAVDGNIGDWKINESALYKRNAYGTSSGMCSMYIPNEPSSGSYSLSDDGTYYIINDCGNGNDSCVVIPEMFDGKPIKEIKESAFFKNTKVVEIYIPNSVTSIGRYAFSGCSSLKKVVLSNNMLSIGSFTFSDCSSLESVTIPNSVTSIGSSAFSGCTSLTNVIIPNSVSRIETYAFSTLNEKATLYCEASEKPTRWSDDWTNSSNIKWGYTGNKTYKSLVVEGNTSYPRFFAGSNSDIPTSINDAKFLVLEDGSLYASAAKITGKIVADEGQIGGLQIGEGEISTGTDGLTFCTDGDNKGLIIAEKLEVNDYFKANEFQVGKISGRNENSPYLNFEGSGKATQSISVKVSAKTVVEGSVGWFGNYEYGKVTLTVTSNKKLVNSKTFEVTSYYKDENSDFKAVIKTNLTIMKGKISASFDILDLRVYNNDYGDDYYCYYSHSTVSPNSYTELTGKDVDAIESGGSFVPLSSKTCNLGTSDKMWSKVYADEVHVNTNYYQAGAVFASDANKKNTINPLEEKYSTLFDMLNPVSFKLNEGTSNRTHIGLIAQELKNSMDACGIDSQDLAAYCSWQDSNGNETYGIRYGEFISLCIYEIQKLKRRISELENK